MILASILAGGWLLCVSALGLEKNDEFLRFLTRAARAAEIARLEPLKTAHDSKTADAVVQMIEEKKLSDAAKQRIAELVAQWPAKGGLDYFEFYLRGHSRLSDEMLRFYAELGYAPFKPYFLGLIAPLKTLPAAEIKEPVRFALALRALGHFPTLAEADVAAIAALLDEKYPHVIRMSATDTLGSIPSRRGLPALVAVVKDSAIGDAAQRSLFRLTGQDFGDAADKWSAWLKEQGAKTELKTLSLSDWETHQKQNTDAPRPEESRDSSTRFYGVEIRTRHCLFMLDCSGSMTGERLAKLKEEMNSVFASLPNKPKSLRFGILAFNTGVEPCLVGHGLLANDPAGLRRAVHFVEKMPALGGTAMVSALQFAATKVLPVSDVDTIYFLSDGQPTDGPPAEVMTLVNRIHSEFQVKFHTIAIGEAVTNASGTDPQPSLLEQMAKQTGGTYTVR